MSPDALAALHARAMTVPDPWSAETFESFLAAPDVILRTTANGFALGRIVLDEAELLTLAVDPKARRAGEGRACLDAFEVAARQRGAVRAFLEVAETNCAARSLYDAAGWRRDGVRRGYYRAPDGSRIDALVLSKSLT